MSFKIIGKAFDIPLKGNDKLVFLSLCEYANDDDNTCYPSYTTLMKKATISRGALRDCLNVLENLGFIDRHSRNRENGSKTSNIYTVFADQDLDPIKYKNRKNLISKNSQSSDNDLGSNDQEMTYPSTNNDLPNGGQSSDNDLLEPLALSLNPYLNPFDEIINHLNQVTDQHYRATTQKTKTLINARLKDGFTVDNFIQVHITKFAEWNGTKFQKYLCPETLYGTKFEKYLNQKLTDTEKINAIANHTGFTPSQMIQELSEPSNETDRIEEARKGWAS